MLRLVSTPAPTEKLHNCFDLKSEELAVEDSQIVLGTIAGCDECGETWFAESSARTPRPYWVTVRNPTFGVMPAVRWVKISTLGPLGRWRVMRRAS